jgi:acetoacetate decarboxylase
MGFEFEKGQPYVMPAHFGPATEGWDGKVAHYEENTSITVLYVTERKAVSALLPPGFVATDPPLISVSFVMCRGVNFMAGGGYNLVAVNVSANFEGKRDRLSGNFALALWENSFAPIMVGREVLGAPKLMADIPDAWMRDGKRGYCVSENGSVLLEGEISGLEKLSDESLQALAAQAAAGTWMGWKYIPSCDLRGADVSTATALPTKATFHEAWMGRGELRFHDVTWEKAPLSFRIVTKLKNLPVVEYQGAVLARLTQDLLIHQQRRIQ